jgi:hypothetical protein
VAEHLVLGDPSSPVRLVRPWADGPHPPRVELRLVERAGCDPAPLDPTTTEGRLTLTSYVWADQPKRLERLRGALAVAAHVPAPVVRSGAAAWLSALAPVDDVVTVVWHSVVRQYLDPSERDALEQLVVDAGQRSTAAAPLVHAHMEPERDAGFRVHARRWPGATEPVHLADCHGHGPPVRWTGASL